MMWKLGGYSSPGEPGLLSTSAGITNMPTIVNISMAKIGSSNLYQAYLATRLTVVNPTTVIEAIFPHLLRSLTNVPTDNASARKLKPIQGEK